MDEEAIIYSVITAVFGISVVVLTLYIFSLVMKILQALFGDKKKKVEPAVSAEAKKVSGEANKEPGWLFAAVAAYMADSDDEKVPLSVLSWQPRQKDSYNAWVHAPKVTQTWTGE